MKEALVILGVWTALAAWRDWPTPLDVLRLLRTRRRRYVRGHSDDVTGNERTDIERRHP